MDCIWIERSRFADEETAREFMEAREDRETMYPHAGAVFKRTRVGDVVYEYHFEPLPPGSALDAWFDYQTQARDPMLTMPGARIRKKSNNGYDPGLTDYDDED